MRVRDLKTAKLVGDETPRIYEMEDADRAVALEWLIAHVGAHYGANFINLGKRAQEALFLVVCDSMERAEPPGRLESRLGYWIHRHGEKQGA